MRPRLLAALLLLAPAVALACNLHLPLALQKSLFPAKEPAAKRVEPAWVGPGHSGSWFNAARAGEGFTLQVLEDGSAVVVWFTFPPAGSTARQSWILGQNGRVEANRIVFEDVYTARGARFGPAFDPSAVQLTRWGRLEFTFASCTEGSVSFQGAAGFGSGSHALTRLTTLDELSCNGGRRLAASGGRATSALRNYAGAFVDPTHGGEGWVIEPFSPTQAGAYWFTYDGNGEQAWLLGIGSLVDGNRLVIDGTLRPVGTNFGSDFNESQVQRLRWGRVEFAFDGCDAATVRYSSAFEGFGDGTLQAQRLTKLASATCLDAAQVRPARAQGTWRSGPRMASPESENAVVIAEGRIYSVGGYQGRRTMQRLDPATGNWDQLAPLPDGRDHALAIGYQGGVWIFGGFSGGQGDPIASWRYDIATNTYEVLPEFVSVGASGAAVLNGQFYLGSDDGTMVQYNPRTRVKRIIDRLGTRLRDHSQVVAYLGEIWMLGGREFTQTGFQMQNGVTIWDPASETWRNGPPMARAHSGFFGVVVQDQIFVGGGEFSSSQGVIPEVGVIGPGEQFWTLAPQLPLPVHGFQGAPYNGEVWTVGGSVNAGRGGSSGTVQIYVPN